MRKPQFVFLDFDGVIMDSMTLKLDSYCHAFARFGFSREAIRKFQRATAGLSRQKVIPLMYASLAGAPMPEAVFPEILERFTAHDESSRAGMVLMPGAGEFLAAARQAGVPMAVITGTPQEVIDRTVDHFDLRRFFVRICGTPGTKSEHVGDLVREFALDPGACFFVGDAIKDQEAAASRGIAFVGVNNGDDPFLPDGLWKEIRSLGEIIPLLLP